MTFKDLQDEIKRRATRNQSGGEYTDATKNVTNTSLFRVGRTAKWRQLRREATFETVTSYSTGSGGGTFTEDSKNVTIVGATLLTDNIQPGRLIKLQGDSYANTIATITGETTLTLTKAYSGDTVAGTGTYTILPQEEYNLPPQVTHRCFLWHEEYGYPFKLGFITDQTFLNSVANRDYSSTVEAYRMWGMDMVQEQVKAATLLSVSSTSAADVNIPITVFGTVAGYPDFEIINTNGTNGTTAVPSTKSFSQIERVSKGSTSIGRIVVTGNSGNTTVATLPVGDMTDGILYAKVRLYPLPSSVFPMNVWYYKDPWSLVNDNDVHELGQEFDEAIILLATSKIIFENNKDEGDKFFNMYENEIHNLRKTNVDKIDFFPTLSRGMRSNSNGGYPHRFLSPAQVGPHFGRRVC